MVVCMDVNEALREGRRLMDEHGLQDWKLALSRATNTLGQAKLNQGTVVLSRTFVELNEWKDVRETVLHEIAHVLVFLKHGNDVNVKPHGREWKNTAYSIGCENVRATARGIVSPERRYRGVCKCGTPHSRQRLAEKDAHLYTCKRCRGPISWTDSQTGRTLL
jgi:predicted SprT family Zn-dependent metalloprotease